MDLVAKRAVEQYLKRRGKFAPKFELLPCCAEKNELECRLQDVELQISRQTVEEKDVSHARKEEISQLGAEVALLRRRVQQRRQRGGEVAEHTAQEIAEIQQQIQRLQREALEDHAKLQVQREAHDKEMARLRQELQSSFVSGECRGLMMRCAELHSASSQLLSMLGQEDLQLPRDLGNAEWLQHLAARFADLHRQLRTPA